MAKPVGDLPPLPPAPEPPVPEPPAEPVPGPAAESVVEPNQVFFVFFSICGALVLFCVLVFCCRPSFRSFWCFSFVLFGFCFRRFRYLGRFFPCHVPLWACSFVTISFPCFFCFSRVLFLIV